MTKYLDYKDKHFGTIKKSIIKRLNPLQKYGYIEVNTNYIYKFRGCTKKTLHEYINDLIEESPVGVKQGGYLIK